MPGKKKKPRPDWDDGRTIANMNIDGMPWYDPRKDVPEAPSEPLIGEDGQELRPERETEDTRPFILPQHDELTGREFRKVVVRATLIGVGIALIFVLSAFLLIEAMLLFWKV